MSIAAAPVDRPRTTRRRRWVVPALLVLLWLVAGGPMVAFAAKLSEVQENDNAAFLPASAESTQVQQLQEKFTGREFLPTIVVYERADGITPPDMAAIAADVRAFGDLAQVVGEVSPPIRSKDGRAVQVVVPLDSNAGRELNDGVAALRETAQSHPGLTAHVTGQGGLLADLSEAFGEIDGLLLAVALVVVLLILVVVYRSPTLPFLVLGTALLALGLASALTYLLAKQDVLDMNGQSQGILSILTIGACTDYGLLLVARFREELHRHESRFEAIRAAWKAAFEPILASGFTVILGVLCLLFSDLNSNKGLGPVAAIGIGASLLTALTFLPAVLTLTGRGAFWPFRPRYNPPGALDAPARRQGFWAGVAAMVGRRPRLVWVTTALVLGVLAGFAPQLQASGVAQTEAFLETVDSVAGQDMLARHFPAGAGSPAVVIARDAARDRVLTAVRSVEGVVSALPYVGRPAGPPPGAEPGQPGEARPPDANSPPAAPIVVDGLVQIQATLAAPPDSAEAITTVERIRKSVHSIEGADAKVGGPTAIQADTEETSTRDLRVLIPIVLAVIFLVLTLLLRALVAPLVLIGTVVLSFAATLGVAALVFNNLFDFPGADPSTPLFGFIFLVALGIDYNIFLMTRVREESAALGTREGTLTGLRVTGGVITSAGVVLAATFAALAVLPLLFLVQVAFIVAFGVLLDTLIVRSLFVSALTIEIGRASWWPSKLSRVRHGTGR